MKSTALTMWATVRLLNKRYHDFTRLIVRE